MKLSTPLLLLLPLANAIGQPTISDTLRVKSNTVVFFTITNSEYDSISKTNPDINEIISDFNYAVRNTIEKLEKEGIVCVFTAHRYFQINTSKGNIEFDRRNGNEKVGVILNRGDKYIIEFGVDTDVGFLTSIREYFRK